jgi:hypothetical protein
VTALALVLATTGAGPGAAVTKGGASVTPLPGAAAVFLVGDSVAYSLWYQFDQGMARDVVVHGSTQLGCGLIAYPLVVDGGPQATDPGCPGFDSRWPHEVRGASPDVAVLMLGIGEQFDRQVDGSTVRFGTPAYHDFLFRELDRRVAVLNEAAHPVVLLSIPCHDAADSGVSDIPKIINDEHRVNWVNGVQREYAAAHASTVTLLDLHGYLCGSGYTNELDGVQLRTDGLHFTVPGAALIWRWLAPQLVAIRDHRRG